MTGKELWAQYQHYTRDFTENSRKLGFGGMAVCWIFRDAAFRFPVFIYTSLLLFVLYFIFDILQSVGGALAIKIFAERAEKEMWETTGSIEGEISKPRSTDRIALSMFCLKALSLVAGFGCIIIELVLRIRG